ncbi:S41 family peptidase [Phreatobacter sp. AB_2022a]|uniref:S41 family peptidase n=1 Tax=Phreatobacter sp. AB_2022a TaxID=3003134 RepID=UPI002286EE68|nr:S41 family peptidase [Phreatobacter sp. AB_2022a]MCZ0737162.1 S41 family peptidase [Phreatobacter sp. AB_2022a]
MMRKASLLLAGAAMGALATVALSQPRAILGMSANAAGSDTYRQINLFGDIFERVRSDYVEKPDDAKLIEAAINGMLSSLDPHSSYMDARNFRDMQVQTRGEFGGLGIEVTQEDGAIKVVAPIDDTPASKAGILANDIITHIDNEPIQGLTLQQAVEKMRGPVGSQITIRVTRTGAAARDIPITRDRIVIRAVRHQVIGDDVGYIRITQFNEQTTDSLRRALEDIRNKVPADKLRGYVVDLRNNPGGLLDQSISVSDAFLERGEIVSTRGRNAEETQRWNARSGDLTGGKPVIVLINGGSASASEIVAGALQDHKRATVLGTRSFGKGSVQTIIPLGSQGALRLTTARYYTPSGRSIQARGIDPDISVEQPLPEELRARIAEAAQQNRGEAGLRGHLRNPNQENNEERSASSGYVPREQKDDIQLNHALDLLRGVRTDPKFPPSTRSAAAPAQPAQPAPAPATPAPANPAPAPSPAPAPAQPAPATPQ